MIQVLEDFFKQKGYDNSVKKVFEIICSKDVFYIEDPADLDDYIDCDKFMAKATEMISEGYSAEWTSHMADSDDELGEVQYAYKKSSQPDIDLDKYISSFKKGGIFAQYIRNHVTGKGGSELQRFFLNDTDNIVELAQNYEKEWNDLLAKGFSTDWIEYYLSPDAKDGIEDIEATLYDFMRMHGRSLEESREAVWLLEFFDTRNSFPNKDFLKYNEEELNAIAKAFAECASLDNVIEDDEESFISFYIKRFLDAFKSSKSTCLNAVEREACEDYKATHTSSRILDRYGY